MCDRPPWARQRPIKSNKQKEMAAASYRRLSFSGFVCVFCFFLSAITGKGKTNKNEDERDRHERVYRCFDARRFFDFPSLSCFFVPCQCLLSPLYFPFLPTLFRLSHLTLQPVESQSDSVIQFKEKLRGHAKFTPTDKERSILCRSYVRYYFPAIWSSSCEPVIVLLGSIDAQVPQA